MAQKIPIAIAKGDGIGPEIMAATLTKFNSSRRTNNAKIYRNRQTKFIYKAYDIWHCTKHMGCFTKYKNSVLKAPITTPQGHGYKSLNVTIRKTMGLFDNIRPC